MPKTVTVSNTNYGCDGCRLQGVECILLVDDYGLGGVTVSGLGLCGDPFGGVVTRLSRR
jgi:hypothetical protein